KSCGRPHWCRKWLPESSRSKRASWIAGIWKPASGCLARRNRMTVMMRSMLEVADNSGARKLQMILPLGGATGLRAGLGDVVTASVKEAAPDGQTKKGTVVKAVIVRTRKEHRRRDGTYIRFDQNAAVLINEAGEPVGTRVFGPVARELREKKILKIGSLAPEVL